MIHSMKEQYAYVQTGEEITLVRCWGAASLALPDTINGLPVTALADHIFAPEPSGKYLPGQIRIAAADVLGDEGSGLPDAPEKEGSGNAVKGNGAFCLPEGEPMATLAREIILPRYLREIGSYAFYGCRSLKRIVFPDTLKKLGSGTFTACNHIEELRFISYGPVSAGEMPELKCLREILGEIDYEVLVTAAACGQYGAADEKELVRLLFPGYYEDSIENTPARIIEVKFEGTGYQYRQCFGSGQIDLAAYDRLFYLASVQENPSTAVKLALGRLAVPTRLEETAAGDYLQYLRSRYMDCADSVIASPDRIELVQMLCRRKYFDRDLLEYWSERLVKAKDPQGAGLLTEYRRKDFPARKKSYSFDDL